jgi:hypothetical protein
MPFTYCCFRIYRETLFAFRAPLQLWFVQQTFAVLASDKSPTRNYHLKVYVSGCMVVSVQIITDADFTIVLGLHGHIQIRSLASVYTGDATTCSTKRTGQPSRRTSVIADFGQQGAACRRLWHQSDARCGIRKGQRRAQRSVRLVLDAQLVDAGLVLLQSPCFVVRSAAIGAIAASSSSATDDLSPAQCG